MNQSLEPRKPEAQRCVAHKTGTGEPCQAYAISGGKVCVYHGGMAPQVREAARRRMAEHIPDALDTLVAALQDSSGAVRVRAADSLLDRLGLKAPEEHVLVPQEATNAALDAALVAALEARGAIVARVLEAEVEEPEDATR